MRHLSLQIPVLVQNTQMGEYPQFVVRPALQPYPIGVHRRYKNAIARFRSEFREVYNGMTFNRQHLSSFGWLLFKPALYYRQLHFEFKLGPEFVSGNFGLLFLNLRGLTFLSFPRVDNQMAILNAEAIKQKALRSTAQKLLRRRLQEIRSDLQEGFNVQVFYSDKREFITEVPVELQINYQDFPLEREERSFFFSFFNQTSDFEGAVEMSKVGQDLNEKYPHELGRAYYRDYEVQNLYQIIYEQGKTPIVLVGAEGVGRHTLVNEVIWRYMEKNQDKAAETLERIYLVDPTRVITGMSIIGQWQQRFEAILDFLMQPERSEFAHKLLIDNPVALLRVGKSSKNDLSLSDVLKPYLEQRQLQTILIASFEEWSVIQEQDRSFSDLFQVFRVLEVDYQTAIHIILEQRANLEAQQGCRISVRAIQQLLHIQRNYLRNQPLPGSVMKLLQQLSTKYRHQDIDREQVREAFQAFSGLKEQIFDPIVAFEKEQIEEVIRQQLFGQEEAVKALANVINLMKSKLVDKQKPVSSFLFVGPTGVGKTQAAKVLAQILTGRDDQLLRFDMNEYNEEGAVERLIGDRQNPEGQLTGAIRYQPFGILLLDEIEKAIPEVHDLLLQVLDEGRLTDSLGRTVDFSNVVIIMTSNAGAEDIRAEVGYKKGQADRAIYFKALRKIFRPEFINRIDQVVVFSPLQKEHIKGITRLQINQLLQRDGFIRRTTIVNITKAAMDWVAERGYDKHMGGRALRRQIERDLTALTAEQLIRLRSDQPIILEVDLQDNWIVPSVTPLSFADPLDEIPLPAAPESKQAGKQFYRKLLDRVELMDKQVGAVTATLQGPEGQILSDEGKVLESWPIFDLQKRIRDCKDHLQKITLGFDDWLFTDAIRSPLRLRKALQRPKEDHSSMEDWKAYFFQDAALQELVDAYQVANNQYDGLKTEFIDNHLDVVLLELALDGLRNQQYDRLQLVIQSMIIGRGETEVEYLLHQYQALMDRLDFSFTTQPEEGRIQVEGFGLKEILIGECGVHFFRRRNQPPLPVRLDIEDPEGRSFSKDRQTIIRLYDGEKTLTDLRTGFSNAYQMNPDELKVLVAAQLNA